MRDARIDAPTVLSPRNARVDRGLAHRGAVLGQGVLAQPLLLRPHRLAVGLAEVRHHLLGHQRHVLDRHPVRHRAPLPARARDDSRAELVGELRQLLDHRVGRADDRVPVLDQEVVGEVVDVRDALLDDRAEEVLERRLRLVSRRDREVRRVLEALPEQPRDVRPRLAVRLLVRLGHVDEDRSAQLLPLHLVVVLLLREAAVRVEGPLQDRSRREHLHEGVVALRCLVDRLQRGEARQPDRRVRLLQGPRPGVDVRQVEVLAVPGERAGLGPRLEDEIVRLPEAVARRARIDPVGVVLVPRAADETGDDPPAGHHVEHRDLLGDTHRVPVQRQRVPDHADPDAVRLRHEVGGHDVRARHRPVRRLVVLVDEHAVVAEPLRQGVELQVLVVEPVPHLRVVVRVREDRPRSTAAPPPAG